ncbi:MAG: hypothetical protein ACLR0N_09595 [Bilophila wadsworthia]
MTPIGSRPENAAHVVVPLASVAAMLSYSMKRLNVLMPSSEKQDAASLRKTSHARAKAGLSSAAPGFLISMRFRSLCSLFKERVQAFFNKGKGCAMPLDESGRVV